VGCDGRIFMQHRSKHLPIQADIGVIIGRFLLVFNIFGLI
jgi:hypothetical protein